MKSFSKVLFVAAMLLWLGARSQQKLTIDQVYSVELRNSGPVIENEQVKGYYFFYKTDKVSKKTNEYTLQLLDANLNKLKDISFVDTKEIVLLEPAFNGSAFMFLFYDYKKGEFIYRTYGIDGVEKKTNVQEFNNSTKAYLNQVLSMQNDDSKLRFLTGVPNTGFICTAPSMTGKTLSFTFAYEISFYTTQGEKKWSYLTDDTGSSSVAFLGQEGAVGLFLLGRVKGSNIDFSVLGLNVNTGKKMFETKASDNKFSLLPANVAKSATANEYVITGPYYKAGDRIWESKSQGIAFMTLDANGNVKSVKYNSWTEEVGKLLPVDQKGRIDNIGYVYLHDIVQTADGKTFAIGEGYAQEKSKVTVRDIMLLQFNNQFTIEKVIVGPKTNPNSNDYKMGLFGGNPHLAASWMKYQGYFDYSFTQVTKNNSSFVVGYTDYDKSKDKKDIVFNSITYVDSQTSKDRIDLHSDATEFKILPGKPGFVLITEYFKKEKRLDMRLEKLN